MSVSNPNSAQNMPQMPSGPNSGLVRRPGVFSQFVQTVAPDPVPTRMQFYRQGVQDYFAKSYVDGNLQYYQNLKKNPGMLSWVGFVTLGLGALFTMFNRFRGAIHYGAALLALVWPVMHCNKTFPKMSEAYKKVKEGNPTEGKEQFKKAMNDTVYNVFHVFLKPMSFAFVLAFILSLPRTARQAKMLKPLLEEAKALRQAGKPVAKELEENIAGIHREMGWINKNVSMRVMNFLHISSETNPIIRFLNIFFKPLDRIGNRFENRVDVKAPNLSKWMQKMS